MATADLTAARVRELLSYDQISGEFTWRHAMCNNAVKAGAKAGTRTRRGYIQLRFDGCSHSAHRLAWLHHYGIHPTHTIDHINGDKSDNRISNLRDVPAAVNKQNMRHSPSKKSALPMGVAEVHRDGLLARFQASIKVGSRSVHLGNFYSPEEAHAAYLAAKRSRHGGCTI